MKVKKAEITAFLSLIVVLLISFIFGIIEITVIQTEKNLSRICAEAVARCAGIKCHDVFSHV